MKSILVHINRDDGQEARLQAALDIVRAFEGHLSCLQTTPIEAFASIEPYGVDFQLAETIARMREMDREEREAMEVRLRGEGISWDWAAEMGDARRLVGEHSWLADLVVVSQPAQDWLPPTPPSPVAADVVLHSRAPVLTVPDDCRGIDCGGPVAIAWNGSPEACAAIRAALPLLERASTVHLIAVTGEDGLDLPSTDASAYLARHGVESELVELERRDAPIAELLLAAATVRKASCLVTGAYGHSRLRENILGGVTRDLLRKAKLPLLLAH